MLWAQLENLMKGNNLLYIAGGGIALVVLIIILKNLGGNRRPDREGGMRENLGEYPPPPASHGSRRLTLNGMPVRVRLVVMAPVGKQHKPIAVDDVPELLDELFRGMPAVLKGDKPRIKIWPPQLSVAGFAPTFHRLVKPPESQGGKSKWVMVAGPTKAGGMPILLGMAVIADEPNRLGLMTLEGADWNDTIRVER